jgi:hypothetical protein
MVLIGCPHVVIFSDIFMATHAEFTLLVPSVNWLLRLAVVYGHSSIDTASLCYFTRMKLKKKFKVIFLKRAPIFMWEGRHNEMKVAEEYCWAMAQAEPLSRYVRVCITTGLPVDCVSSITTCLKLVLLRILRIMAIATYIGECLQTPLYVLTRCGSPDEVGRIFLWKIDA